MHQTKRRVTPSMLGQAKARVSIQHSASYSHERQSGTGADPIRMATWNQTKTYDPRGNPRDSDNDK